MAGILDVKSRVMDTLVTAEGRRQIATGELRIHFASFTDRHMFYASGSNSVFEDPTSRIYFEAYSDDNDKIIIETDAEGRMEPFSSDTYSSYNGNFQFDHPRRPRAFLSRQSQKSSLVCQLN